MSKINDVCQSVVNDVDGALACSVVDLNSGLMLGAAHKVPYFSQTYMDAVAAAAVEMFRGKNVRVVEKLLSQQRGEPVENSIEEMQMSTKGTYHFMSIIPEKPTALVVLVTTRSANLGMGWNAVRRSLGELSPHCP